MGGFSSVDDAHRIAAVNELFDALTLALDILPDCDNPHVEDVISTARAALAKADAR
jgi:hypothetical protein